MGKKRGFFTRNRRSKTWVWVILIVVGLVGLTACSLTDQGISRRDHAAALQTEIAQRVALEIELRITDRTRDLQLLIQVSGLKDLSEADQRLILSEVLAFDDTFEELALLDSTGQEVIRESRREIVNDSDLHDRSDQPEFVEAVASRETYFGPVVFDPATGDPMMAISIHITDLRSGQVPYVLVGQFRFRAIWEIIQAQALSEGQDLYLVDSNSRVIAHRDSSVMLADTRYETDGRETLTTGLNGNPVVIGLTPFTVGEQTFTMVAELTTAAADK